MPLTKVTLDIRNWIKNIEQHASDNVNKILVGNKADMDESKRVKDSVFACKIIQYQPACISDKFSILHFVFLLQAVTTAQGQALANEYKLNFFETVSFLCVCVLVRAISGIFRYEGAARMVVIQKCKLEDTPFYQTPLQPAIMKL